MEKPAPAAPSAPRGAGRGKLIVGVVVAVIVVGVVAAVLLMRGGGPTISSLDVKVGGLRCRIKNIGSSDLKIRGDTGGDFAFIYDLGSMKVLYGQYENSIPSPPSNISISNIEAGEAVALSFVLNYYTWIGGVPTFGLGVDDNVWAAFEIARTPLVGWTGGEYTYTDPLTNTPLTLYDITINPSLPDSLFQAG